MPLIFCDAETTGLDPARHEIWEIGYAVDEGPIQSAFVPHSLLGADPEALLIGKYHERYFPGVPAAEIRFEVNLVAALDGATLVAANPSFDSDFLKARWNRWAKTPWKYRMIDVETYAMPALHLDEPQGLKYIAEQLHLENQPDHTAGGDVAAVREAFYTLRNIYDERLS